MPTLAANQFGTDTLRAGRRTTVLAPAGSTALVERFRNGVLLDKDTLQSVPSKIYGPYDTDVQLRVTCVVGSIIYRDTQSTDAIGAVRGNDKAPLYGGMLKWQAAKARGYSFRQGTLGFSSQARFLMIGDSNVSGQGSGTGTNGFLNAGNVGMAGTLAKLLGFRADNYFGDQGSGITNAYKPGVIDVGADWTPDSNGQSIVGGRAWVGSGGGSAGMLRLLPSSQTDRFVLWRYAVVGLNSLLSSYLDGNLLETVNQNTGTQGLRTAEYQFPRGLGHAFGLKTGADPQGGVGVIAGIESFDSTSVTPVFIQGGATGTASDYWTNKANPWNPGNMLPTMQPDFTCLYLTINDITAATSPVTYYNRIESLVASLPNSDGCLCVGFPANHDGTISGALDVYAQILRNIAGDYGWHFFDSRSVFGSSIANVTGRGLMYNDDHPNGAGHAAFANALYAFLKSSGI